MYIEMKRRIEYNVRNCTLYSIATYFYIRSHRERETVAILESTGISRKIPPEEKYWWVGRD